MGASKATPQHRLLYLVGNERGDNRMSFVLQKYQKHVVSTVSAHQAMIREVEGDIRLRAMSNDTNIAELRLLQRLKDECSALLYRYQGLNEGFKCVLGSIDVAAE